MQSRARSRAKWVLALGAAGMMGGAGIANANDIPLRRDLPSYFIFAMKTLQLKDLHLADACNIGVNCQQPNSSSECGSAQFSDPFLGNGSQVASDRIGFSQGGGQAFQVFKNTGSVANVTINHPGAQPDGSDLLSPLPILGNEDGDANPSCGTTCNPDYGDVQMACGFPAPFPACNPGNDVIAPLGGGDCVPPTADSNLGNGVCDLIPDTYGSIVALDGAKVKFAGGTYTACDATFGKSSETTSAGGTVLNLETGGFGVGNQGEFGRLCGDFTVNVKAAADVTFGKNGSISAKVCAPQSFMRLGHGNTLRGQFVGDTVVADLGNQGFCCPFGGSCTCYDLFSPTTAQVGDTITLSGHCDLTKVTAVKVNCGGPDIPAVIDLKNVTELKFKVPAGAAGACTIIVDSAAGTFSGTGVLTVN